MGWFRRMFYFFKPLRLDRLSGHRWKAIRNFYRWERRGKASK